jgi:hypothetical protein
LELLKQPATLSSLPHCCCHASSPRWIQLHITPATTAALFHSHAIFTHIMLLNIFRRTLLVRLHWT